MICSRSLISKYCKSFAKQFIAQFHNQFVNDTEKFNQFAQVIAQFIQQLREDADAYDKVEAENASIAMTRK